MQIHELDTYIGTPSETDFMAVDDGTETFKIPLPSVGVSTPMTAEEAEAGTVTEPRVITPAVINSYVNDTVDTAVTAMAETLKTLVINISSFSSLPKTVTHSKIRSDMTVTEWLLGNPSAQVADDWQVTTSNGSLVITGTISGSTTMVLKLESAEEITV